MKKHLSLFIALILVIFTVVPAFSAAPSERLYNVYGDGMLFQQKAEAVLSGLGKAGDKISCTVKNSIGEVYAETSSTVGSDGVFKVSFNAPAGSYEEYTIILKADNVVFDTLENIVFGELWLSGGQSNMQLELRYSSTGKEMLVNGTTGSKNVRYFYSAPSPEYNGNTNNLPYNPQTEIPGCCWFDGTDSRIFDISGVGFFFAEKLQKDLGMPVGLLSGSLGGSSITAWIPRDVIEADKSVKIDLGSSYISEKNWKEDGSLSVMTACSGMYNKKIAPLENFRPKGMIWYQGESDASWDHGRYSRLFDTLQDSYAEKFNYDGDFPIVYSAVCDFSFGSNDTFKLISSEFAEMQTFRPESRAVISLSDIPLTFWVPTQACHPIEKKPVGERMAYAAQGLVYGADNCVSAPNLKKSEIKDGSVYLTFNYCGDTLKAKGDRIYGFTICGKDGIYLPAEADIVSNDTIRVYSDSVKNPKAAMYANGLITGRCNLYAYKDGEYIWPVLPTVTDWSRTENIWTDFGWTDCDTDEIWRTETLTISDYYKIWESKNAEVEISPDSAFKGNGGLSIKADSEKFSVSPITEYVNEENEKNIFLEFNQNWANYKTMSVMVRNDGDSDIIFSGLKIYKENGKFVTPLINGTKNCNTVIPADGKWHEVTFNLNTMLLNGKKLPVAASRTYLTDVIDVEFCFEGENAQISMDEISFETSGLTAPVIKLLGFDPISLLFNAITSIIGLFRV